MDQNLRRVFVDKLGKKKKEILFNDFSYTLSEEIREQKEHCTIQWSDTKKFEVIKQEYIRLPPLQNPEINVTYTIVIDGTRRYGTVIAAGNTK